MVDMKCCVAYTKRGWPIKVIMVNSSCCVNYIKQGGHIWVIIVICELYQTKVAYMGHYCNV